MEDKTKSYRVIEVDNIGPYLENGVNITPQTPISAQTGTSLLTPNPFTYQYTKTGDYVTITWPQLTLQSSSSGVVIPIASDIGPTIEQGGGGVWNDSGTERSCGVRISTDPNLYFDLHNGGPTPTTDYIYAGTLKYYLK